MNSCPVRSVRWLLTLFLQLDNIRSVKCRGFYLALVALGILAFPLRAPAPLIYTPGQGWRYERAGGEGKWLRTRAKDQVEVAQNAFDQNDYSLARRAAHRPKARPRALLIVICAKRMRQPIICVSSVNICG